jgi:hypothetical protein
MQAFYSTILMPLGYTIYLENHPKLYGLASSAGPDFWLHCEDAELSKFDATSGVIPAGKTHVAFNAESREIVNQWYEVATFVTPMMPSNWFDIDE